MSHTTHVFLLSKSNSAWSIDVIESFVSYFGVTPNICSIWREEDHSWEWYQIDEQRFSETESIEYSSLRAAIFRSFGASLSFSKVPLIRQLKEECREAILADIGGDFLPDKLGLSAGPHDVFGANEFDQVVLFGRASISIDLWGYHYPNDRRKFEDLFVALPTFIRLRNKMIELAGSAEVFFNYS